LELRVEPLASDSLGVRSLATYVNTGELCILIDPATALAPERYGLPPHHLEEEVRGQLWRGIKEKAEEAEILIVTHYHYDHIDPDELGIYTDKTVLVKHPRRMINTSQWRRASEIIPRLREVALELLYADGRSFEFGDLEIRFSKPVPHGPDTRRGYVLEVSVRGDEVFLYTSDVQGPLLEEQLNFILEERPHLIFIDGPTTYIEHPRLDIELEWARRSLLRMLEEVESSRIVLDHHLTRDLEYRERLLEVYERGEELGIRVESAAEYLGLEPRLLEARRRELYGGDQEET
jgi:hypothetical protein